MTPQTVTLELAGPLFAWALAYGAATLVPLAWLFRRAGLHWGWAALTLVPWIGPVLAPAVLAHRWWPVLPGRPADTRPPRRARIASRQDG